MSDPFVSALDELYAQPGAETVSFLPVAAAAVPGVRAIRSHADAGDIPGLKNTTRSTTFEVRYASLPERPRKDDRIEASDRIWSVVQVIDRDDVGAWLLAVERAAA